MLQSRTWHSPVRDFPPAIPTVIQISWGLAGAVPQTSRLSSVRWRDEPQLPQQKWASLAEQTLVKKQSRNGGLKGPSCLHRHSPGRKSHWSQLWEQLVQNSSSPKTLEGRQWILDFPLPHLQPPFKRRKQQRHVQSHGHAFGEHQEWPKELQQNTQFLHLGLNYIQRWPLPARQGHSQSWAAKEKGNKELLKQSTEIKGPFFLLPILTPH